MAKKYDYNAQRQLRELRKYDFNNKSDKEIIKYVANKLNKVGYKVPKYMLQGKLNEKQLEIQLNKLNRRLGKQAEEEKRLKDKTKAKKSADKPKRRTKTTEEKIQENLNKYNKNVTRIYNYIDKNYSGWKNDYLKGSAFTTFTDFEIYREDTFEFIDSVEQLTMKEDKERLKFLKDRVKDSNFNNFKNSLEADFKTMKTEFEDFLNDEIFGFTNLDIYNINKYAEDNNLDALELEVLMRGELTQLKEKYKKLKDELGDVYNEDLALTRIYNYTIVNIDRLVNMR